MNAVVELEGVDFAYDRSPILSSVSISIEQGEWIALIGPNGGGKTTLLKLILGFLEPTVGVVRLREPRSRIGYVPQSLGFDSKFPISLLELVMTGRLAKLKWHGRYGRTDRRLAMEALEQVGLTPFIHRRFSELSGGQRQRALIARALVSSPSLLLLDEFTANLDSAAEASIYRFLQSLKKQMTIVMVTHDLEALSRQVDRVLSVRREVSSIPPKEVCDHFSLGLYHGHQP